MYVLCGVTFSTYRYLVNFAIQLVETWKHSWSQNHGQ